MRPSASVGSSTSPLRQTVSTRPRPETDIGPGEAKTAQPLEPQIVIVPAVPALRVTCVIPTASTPENNPAQTSAIVTSTLPRVAFEYAQISCASSTSAFAVSRSKSGSLTLSRML